MVSRAPVSSPTAIIWTTMAGKVGCLDRGVARLSPSRTEHLDLELEPVPLVPALLAGLPLAEQEAQHNSAQHHDQEEAAQELGGAHQHPGRQRPGAAQGPIKVRER